MKALEPLVGQPIGWRSGGIAIATIMFVLLIRPSPAFTSPITLASAQSFAVLGGAGVTVGGASGTVVSGNLGVHPYALGSISGFPTPATLVNGAFYALDQLPLTAQQARLDANTAYLALAALPSTAGLSGIVLGTGGTVSTLSPGVYTFSSSAQVNGDLTLDFSGLSNSMFVFQIASTLTTGSGSSIRVIGGDSTNAIYWQVGDSATLGSSTAFAGNILALNAITLNPFASIGCGRAFAYTASVTMADRNFISNDCSLYNTGTGYSAAGPSDFGSYGFSGAPQVGVPEPGTFLLLGFGLAALVMFSGRRPSPEGPLASE
jgi:hypothetical protein